MFYPGNSGYTIVNNSAADLKIYYSEQFEPGTGLHRITVTGLALIPHTLVNRDVYLSGSLFIPAVISAGRHYELSKYSCRCSLGAAGTECPVTVDGTSSISWTGADGFSNGDGSKIEICLTASEYYGGQSLLSIDTKAAVSLHPIYAPTSPAVGDVTLGTAATVTLSAASADITHTLKYTIGSHTVELGTGLTGSVTFTAPLSYADAFPNSETGIGALECSSYEGSVPLGTRQTQFRVLLPETVKPSAGSLVIEPWSDSVPSDWNIYVQSKSKANAKIQGAAGVYGSTIKAYSITTLYGTEAEQEITTGYLNRSGSCVFSAKVQDSRGRWSDEITSTITVVSYSTPAIKSFSTERCLANGTPNASGTYLRALLKYSYSSCDGHNTVTCSAEYKRKTTSSWTEGPSITSGTAAVFGAGAIATDYSYDVRYTLTDAFRTVTVTDTIATAAVILDFKSGGTGMAVGKVAEADGLEVAWPANFTGGLKINGSADMTDVVVAQGYDSEHKFYYRKWNSGHCEIWGKRTVSTVLINTYRDNGFYSGTGYINLVLPFSAKLEAVSLSIEDSPVWVAPLPREGFVASVQYRYWSTIPISLTTPVIHIHISGLWKE